MRIGRSLHFLLPVLVAAVLLFGGWTWLRLYTKHGVGMRVPDLSGMGYSEAEQALATRELRILVIDSVHSDDHPKGTVVDQDPDAGLEVKPGRKVYVVMNATLPKMIDMPRLVDLSKRQAISILDILGLKVRELQYKPDPCVDCVIAQLYEGQPIAPDTRIRKGEAITLVLGSGDHGERVPIPDLLGLTNAEVAMVLNMSSLNLGVLVQCDGCNTPADSAFARVRRQSPPANERDRIPLGSTIDVWLTADTTGLKRRTERTDMPLTPGTDTGNDVDQEP